jgi:hypothetical protein
MLKNNLAVSKKTTARRNANPTSRRKNSWQE